MNILVCKHIDCQTKEIEDTYKELMNYVEDVHFMHASCLEMCEHGPLLLVLPDTIFYQNVTKEDVYDLIHGNLKDHIYPLEHLYSSDMDVYLSDPMHRRSVKLFRYQLEKMKAHDWRSIRDVLPIFESKYDVELESLYKAVRMALLGTTKGPELAKLIDMLGISETYVRIDRYLQDNKYRI